MSNPQLRLEHHVLRRAAEINPGRRWLIACSGGVDSMVLAEVVRRWRGRLTDRLVIAHVHHGLGPAHRDEARTTVRAWAAAHRLPFVTNAPGPAGASDEAALRELRFAHLERWRQKYECDVICLAHHRDDQIETQLMRLVRGTGTAGVRGMGARAGPRFRPLLEVSRAEIAAYAHARRLNWREDPSNADPGASVRAWVRGEWLPALEARCPGAGASLARSLSLLAEPAPAWPAVDAVAIRREPFARATVARRESIVTAYVRTLGARQYGRTHVREIVKRLDSRRKEFSFTLLGHTFSVTHQFWWASRVCEKPTPC